MRILLILSGLAAIGFGVVSAFARPVPELISAATWFVAGIAVHDGLFAPVCLAAWFLMLRRAPTWVSVCSFLTLVLALIALPVLGRTLPNPTVLDRDYGRGLVAAVIAVWSVGGLYALIRRQRQRASSAAPVSV